MGRPRTYDEDALLDAAERLLAAGEAVTVRSLSRASGATTGSIYHAFGSLDELLASAWLRAASRFLETLEGLIEEDPAAPAAADADRAIEAAARTLLVLEGDHPDSARLLMAHPRESLITAGLPDELLRRAAARERRLMAGLEQLARRRSGRATRDALDVVVACVVDIPTAILLPRRPGRRHAEALLAAAVRGVLAERP